MITGAQIRAGRAMARWSTNELGSRSRLARMTIVRAEAVDGPPATTDANLVAIKNALEAAGVKFLENGRVAFEPSKPLPSESIRSRK